MAWQTNPPLTAKALKKIKFFSINGSKGICQDLVDNKRLAIGSRFNHP